jgi:hypothetical protein
VYFADLPIDRQEQRFGQKAETVPEDGKGNSGQ